jgi:hypothetical protein
MITLGSPPSMIATTEFVVPKSIPMIFVAMNRYLLYRSHTTGSRAIASILAASDETMFIGGDCSCLPQPAAYSTPFNEPCSGLDPRRL